jgi:PAS domain S-box-containing protein
MRNKSKTSDILDSLMVGKGFRRKRDVAKYFGVSPQALSLWIAKDKIPPKHLLKISKETIKKRTLPMSIESKSINEDKEHKTVIDYLMRENVALKEKVKHLEVHKKRQDSFIPEGDLFNKIMADSLLIAGRVSDGIITQVEGRWSEIMGYSANQLTGLRYDREDLIHPDELKRVQKIQQTLKNSESISQSKYSTIQRWKHGKSNKYIMLSMVWEVDLTKDTAIILSKPIDRFMSE